MALNIIWLFVLINLINHKLSILQECFIHIFADEFVSSIIVINDEKPWLEVIIRNGLVFSIFLLLLPCIVLFTIFTVLCVTESNLYCLVIETTANLVRFYIDPNLLMVVHFEHINKFIIYP